MDHLWALAKEGVGAVLITALIIFGIAYAVHLALKYYAAENPSDEE